MFIRKQDICITHVLYFSMILKSNQKRMALLDERLLMFRYAYCSLRRDKTCVIIIVLKYVHRRGSLSTLITLFHTLSVKLDMYVLFIFVAVDLI